MFKIKRGDTVQVTKGRDAGKKGKILRIFRENRRALVEGVNLVKKHRRKTRQDQQGGVVSIESPVSLANLMLLCKSCNRPVRAAFSVLNDGSKSRVCSSCKEVI